MQLKFGKTKISPTRRQWIVLALGIVLIGLGSLGVPLAYRLILVSDLLLLTGLLLAFIAMRQFEGKDLPAIDVLDGFVVSGLIIFFVLGVAYMSYKSYSSGNLTTVFRLAVSAGALGGLIHEVFQSGGKFAMPQLQQPQNEAKSQENPQKKSEVDSPNASWYLGSISGLLFGAVAGLLLAQTITPPSGAVAIAAQAFFAGLALKGVAEAAVDTQAKKTQS